MLEDHTWPGKPHNIANIFSHLRLVAMNTAIAAGWFVFLKRAVFEPFFCIVQKTSAGRAERIPEVVVGSAVDGDHGFNGGQLTLHFRLFGVLCPFFSHVIQSRP